MLDILMLIFSLPFGVHYSPLHLVITGDFATASEAELEAVGRNDTGFLCTNVSSGQLP